MNIDQGIDIDDQEFVISYIRSPGPGGQNVNKVATGVHLRFDVKHSPSLSEEVRERLLIKLDSKLTRQGVLVIKAIRFRTQIKNRLDALERLKQMLVTAMHVAKKRKKSKPTLSSSKKRLETKKRHGQNKSIRSNKRHFDD